MKTVEAWCCYLINVLFHCQLFVQVNIQVTHDPWRILIQHAPSNCDHLSWQCSHGIQPHRLTCLVGIQLQPMRCPQACNVRHTIRQTRPYCINVFRSAASVQLSIVSVQVWFCFVFDQWCHMCKQQIQLDPGQILEERCSELENLMSADQYRRKTVLDHLKIGVHATDWKPCWSQRRDWTGLTEVLSDPRCLVTQVERPNHCR